MKVTFFEKKKTIILTRLIFFQLSKVPTNKYMLRVAEEHQKRLWNMFKVCEMGRKPEKNLKKYFLVESLKLWT